MQATATTGWTSKAAASLRGNAVIVIALAAAVAHHVAYLGAATANIAYQDILSMTPMLEKLYSGTLTLGDIWAPYNGVHRAPGGLLIYLGNALFFHLDTRIELFLGAVWMVGLSFVLFERFRKSLAGAPPAAVQIAFLAVIAIVFSLLQWENFVFNGGTYHVLQAFVFAGAFTSLDRLNERPSPARFGALALTAALTTLVFSSGYSVAAGITLIVGPLLLAMGAPGRGTRLHLIASAALCATYLVVYSIGLDFKAAAPSGAPWWSDPVRAVRFLLHVESAQLAGAGWLDRLLAGGGRDALGALLIVVEGAAFLVGIARGLHRRTVTPFLLILHAQLVSGSILVSRINFGLNGAIASRYITHVQLALIGAAWIIVMLAREDRSRASSRVAGLALPPFVVLIVFAQASIAWQEWRIAPYRKDAYNRMRTFALAPQRYSDDEIGLFQNGSRANTERGLAILRRHRLNVYADLPQAMLPALPPAVIYRAGWYGAEAGGRWMRRRATARVRTGPDGKIDVRGYLSPEAVRALNGPLDLLVSVSGGAVKAARVGAGGFTVTADAMPDSEVEIELKAGHSFVPANVGLGADQRELSLFVTEIVGH